MKYFLSALFVFLFSVSAYAQYNFSDVDRLLQDSVEQAGGIAGGYALLLIKDGIIIYNKAFGTYTVDRVVPVASATKWLSAGVVMSLVDEGRLSLDDTVGKYLPMFTGKKGGMTIRQLMSHTSGLPGESPYHTDRSLTLAQAVDSIGLKVDLIADPGTQFFYGGVSMQVAGRIAEIVTGKSWDSIFAERMTRPLGMVRTNYDGLGQTDNPQIAGGAQCSATEYALYLSMIMNGGIVNGKHILSEKAIMEMQKDQTNVVPFFYTPYSQYAYLDPDLPKTRYGIGEWREVIDKTTGELQEVSSQGAFGFSPWIDLKRNLVGVLSVRSLLKSVAPTYFELKKRIHMAIDSPTRVEEEGAGNYILTLFPNPVCSNNEVFCVLPKIGPVRFTLIDMFGRVVLTFQDSEERIYHSFTLTPSVSNGIYSCILAMPSRTVIRRLVITR